MAQRGRPKSEETKAKMRAAALGRKHSPETIAKIAAARRARKPLLERVYESNQLRRKRERELRFWQQRKDLMDARRISPELARDVARSDGWWVRRHMHDPRISDGWSRSGGGIMWYPRRRKLRAHGYLTIHLWKKQHGNHQRL